MPHRINPILPSSTKSSISVVLQQEANSIISNLLSLYIISKKLVIIQKEPELGSSCVLKFERSCNVCSISTEIVVLELSIIITTALYYKFLALQ